MSICLDMLRQGMPMASVSIRRLSALPGEEPVYAYEITSPHHPTVRGTVEHSGAENLVLVATVLADYVQRNPDRHLP